jgi:pimeloyl-ACP methyl ester carboxylesterase
MKSGAMLTLIALAMMLASCAQFSPATEPAQTPAPIDAMIKPGGEIGAMTLEQGAPTLPYPYLWQFCDSMPDKHEPTASTSECKVPRMSGVTIHLGWLARESKLESNWDALAYELSIDGQKIDLAAFEPYDSDYTTHGEDNRSRQWLLNLRGLTPGAHTLQITQTMETPVDDGMNVYQPGTYTHEVSFTVLEKETYPQLSSAGKPGQQGYTSKEAGLDFLLYLPNDYGKDAQQEWPMIVYLHGAPLRGSTLELLKDEPLPKQLENKGDFPFMVVSPLGDGDYEFWSRGEMPEALFKLLEEIKASLLVDAKRIYLTGNDLGGNGVWALGLRNPETFAALAPVAGYAAYPFAVPDNICDLKDVPVWAFHGKRDPYVPAEVEQELVDALNACGGEAKITVSTDMKNDVPFKVYADPGLYEWLLGQEK